MPSFAPLTRKMERAVDEMKIIGGTNRNETSIKEPGDIVAWRFLFWTFILQVKSFDSAECLYDCRTRNDKWIPFSFDGSDLRLLDVRDIVMLRNK
jgi:hypothetical protein